MKASNTGAFMSSSRYEISFLLDDELCQHQFIGEQSVAEEIRLALEADLKAIDFTRKGDIQVYDAGSAEAGGAEELVETILNAACVDDEDEDIQAKIKALHALAAEVDARAQATAADKRVAYLAEFIWNNGGGDDNPFSQAFQVGARGKKTANGFIQALNDVLEDGDIAYDFSCAPEDGKHEVLSIPDALQATIDTLAQAGVAAPRLEQLRQAHQLDATVTTPSTPRRRRTL